MKRSEINNTFRWDAASNATVISGGDEYIDFTSGIFVANLGHNNPAVNQAVSDAIRQYGPHSYTYGLPIRNEYIKRLCEWSGFDHAHLFTTGSEAVEAAMRVAWHLGHDADDFYALPGTFHGKTWGPNIIARRVPDDFGYDFGKRDVVLVEAYRGWDCHFWSRDDINAVKQSDIVIVDEVQSGFYRTGMKFAHFWYGDDHFKPDMVVIGKAQGNGYPISAVLARGRCADVLKTKADDFSSTHGGNPVACAAGMAVLDQIDKAAEWIKDLPLHGSSGHVAAIHTDTARRSDEVVLKCRERGLLVVHTGKASVKIGPPLTIPKDQLDAGISILKEVLTECGI